MTPAAAYRRLNAILWLNRLPKTKIVLVEDATLPRCYGLTIHDDVCVRPVILLNAKYKNWGKTLVHEMVHIAEPQLRHGPLFTALVEGHWQLARLKLKGLRTL
jgi:hypothetical protein